VLFFGGTKHGLKEIRPRSCGNKKIEEIREVQEVSTLAVMCTDITVEKRPITWEVEMTLETIISKEHALHSAIARRTQQVTMKGVVEPRGRQGPCPLRYDNIFY
jgi:hypothetical protein